MKKIYSEDSTNGSEKDNTEMRSSESFTESEEDIRKGVAYAAKNNQNRPSSDSEASSLEEPLASKKSLSQCFGISISTAESCPVRSIPDMNGSSPSLCNCCRKPVKDCLTNFGRQLQKNKIEGKIVGGTKQKVRSSSSLNTSSAKPESKSVYPLEQLRTIDVHTSLDEGTLKPVSLCSQVEREQIQLSASSLNYEQRASAKDVRKHRNRKSSTTSPNAVASVDTGYKSVTGTTISEISKETAELNCKSNRSRTSSQPICSANHLEVGARPRSYSEPTNTRNTIENQGSLGFTQLHRILVLVIFSITQIPFFFICVEVMSEAFELLYCYGKGHRFWTSSCFWLSASTIFTSVLQSGNLVIGLLVAAARNSGGNWFDVGDLIFAVLGINIGKTLSPYLYHIFLNYYQRHNLENVTGSYRSLVLVVSNILSTTLTVLLLLPLLLFLPWDNAIDDVYSRNESDPVFSFIVTRVIWVNSCILDVRPKCDTRHLVPSDLGACTMMCNAPPTIKMFAYQLSSLTCTGIGIFMIFLGLMMLCLLCIGKFRVNKYLSKDINYESLRMDNGDLRNPPFNFRAFFIMSGTIFTLMTQSSSVSTHLLINKVSTLRMQETEAYMLLQGSHLGSAVPVFLLFLCILRESYWSPIRVIVITHLLFNMLSVTLWGLLPWPVASFPLQTARYLIYQRRLVLVGAILLFVIIPIVVLLLSIVVPLQVPICVISVVIILILVTINHWNRRRPQNASRPSIIT